MQKKIIASLLVSPVAITAMANINVSGVPVDGWKSANGAIIGGSLVTGNKVTCPVGTGAITNKFLAPAPGKYQIKIGSLTNAVLTVNGVDAVANADKDGFIFEVTKENLANDVIFTVTPVNKNAEFSFEQGDTEIVFNFAEAKSALDTAFAGIPTIETLDPLNDDADEDAQEAYDALKARVDAAKAEKTRIEGIINNFPADDDAADANLQTYTDYNLGSNPNDIQAAITALINQIGVKAVPEGGTEPEYGENTINSDVEKENKLINAKKLNGEAKDAATTEYNDLNTALAALQTAYDNASAYTKGECADDLQTIKDDIVDFKTAIDDTFTEENMSDPDLDFAPNPDATAINALITALTTKIGDLEKKVAAFNGFQAWYTNESTVEKVYNQSRIAISSLKSLTAYAGAFESYKAKQMNALAAEYNKCTAYVTEGNANYISIDSTEEQIEAAKTAIGGFVQAMTDLTNLTKKTVKDQNDLMGDGVYDEDGELTTTPALTVIADLQKTLDDSTSGMTEATLTALGVKPEKIATYLAAVKKVQDAIDALKENCEALYKELKLTADDFAAGDTKFDAVGPAQTDLDDTITALSLQSYKDAAKAITDANAELKKLTDRLTECDETGVNFTKLFSGNVTNLQAAIDGLHVDEDNPTDTSAYENKQIIAQIQAAIDWANTIYDAVETSGEKITNFETALGQLKQYVADKTVMTGNGADFTTAGINQNITTLEGKVNTWNGMYQEIKKSSEDPNTTGQDVYDAANELMDQIKEEVLNKDLTDNFNELENKGTESNLKVVQAALQAVEDDTEAVVDVTTLKADLATIAAAVATEVAKEATWGAENTSTDDDGNEVKTSAVADKAAACAALDTQLSDLAADIQKIADSQTAYKALLPSLDGVLLAIEDDVTYNKNSVSGEDAQNHYTGIIGEVAADADAEAAAVAKDENGVPDVSKATTLYGKYYTLKALLKTYLDAGTVAEYKDAYTTTLGDVKDQATTLKAEMMGNESALYDLLNKSQSTRNILEGYLAQLNGTSTAVDPETGEPKVNYDPEIKAVQDAIDAINVLLDSNLMAADSAVMEAYGEGNCAVRNSEDKYVADPELIAPYNTIETDAAKVISDLNGEYGKIVAQVNADMLKDKDVDIANKIIAANADYSAAIKVFNAYKNMNNEGYLAYIAKEGAGKSQNHEKLYEYATKIIQLRTDYQEAVKVANGKPEILDKADFIKDYVDVLAGYVANINKLKNDIIDDYNTWGNGYYTELLQTVNDNIKDAETTLKGAGLEGSIATILADANDAVTAAGVAKTAADAVKAPAAGEENPDVNYYLKQIGYVMNSIANSLNDYSGDAIDLTNAANKAWSNAYNGYTNEAGVKVLGAVDQIEAWNEEVAAFEFVSDTEKAAYQTVADKALEDVKAANNGFTAVTNTNRIGTLKEYMDMLNAALATLNGTGEDGQQLGAYTKIKNLNAANGEQKELKATLEGMVTDLNSQLAALKLFASPMGVASSISYDAITNAITAINTKITDSVNSTSLEADQNEIKSDILAVTGQIAAMYQTVADQEKAFLEKLLDQAKVAYNNASSVSGDFLDQSKTIDDLEAKIAALKLYATPSEEVTPDPDETNTPSTLADDDTEGTGTGETEGTGTGEGDGDGDGDTEEPGDDNTESVPGTIVTPATPSAALAAARAAFSEKAVEYENSLSTVIAELQATPNYPEVPGEVTVDSILDKLNALSGEIGNAINDAVEDIEGYSPELDEYMQEYADLLKKLGEVTEEFNEVGDAILAQEGNYTQQLNDIKDTFEAMQPEVAKAKEAAQAAIDSNNLYNNVFLPQYNALQSLFEAAQTALGKDGYDVLEKNYQDGKTYGEKLGAISDDLDDMENWLNENKEEHTFTETSAWIGQDNATAASLDYAIKAARLSGGKLYATNLNDGDTDGAAGKVQALQNALETTDALADVKAEVSAKATTLASNQSSNSSAIAAFAVSDFQTTTEDGATSISNAKYEEAISDITGFVDEANRIIKEADKLIAQLAASEYTPGAVFGGDEVTANDIQQIIQWAAEGATEESIADNPAWGPIAAAAADLNDDKVIDINDVTLAIQYYLKGQDSETLSVAQIKLARYAAPAVDHSLRMGIAEEGENDGVRRFAITLDNTLPIIAGQIDLNLPAGMRVVDASVAERNGNHSVVFSDNGDYTRVLIFSMDNAAFDSTTGAVVYIDVEGVGNLSVDQMMVTDSYLQSHILEGANTSFVDTIIDGAKEAGSRIYNAAGMMFNKLQKGINIIRDANGKVRKEYNRK